MPRNDNVSIVATFRGEEPIDATAGTKPSEGLCLVGESQVDKPRTKTTMNRQDPTRAITSSFTGDDQASNSPRADGRLHSELQSRRDRLQKLLGRLRESQKHHNVNRRS